MIQGDDEEKLSASTIQLLFAFIKFTFLRVPTIWWKTTIRCRLDNLTNVYFLMTIYMEIYLVDVVLIKKESSEKELFFGSRGMTIAILALGLVLIYLVLLLAARIQVSVLDVSRPIMTHLRVNLFRKYLNFSEKSMEKIQVQDFTVAMDTDVPLIVETGYMCVFPLIRTSMWAEHLRGSRPA